MKNKDIENGMMVKIKGEIKYMQDHGFHKGSFPKDVVFTIVDKTADKTYKLTADGYGMFFPENHYGNGAIYVSKKWAKNFIKVGDMFWRGPKHNKYCSKCGAMI